jgi:protein-tyrosine-phosphatase
MAEGWARTLKSGVIEAHSAGTEAHGLNPNAVKVMAEVDTLIFPATSQKLQPASRQRSSITSSLFALTLIRTARFSPEMPSRFIMDLMTRRD